MVQKYIILASYKNYAISKSHVQDFRQDIEMQTLCGKYLGFDFGVATYDGFENNEACLVTDEEVYYKSDMCKKCIKVLYKLTENK